MAQTAIIRSTHLGPEDHGILTAFLNLEGDGWAQGFGGYDLRAEGECVKWIDGILKALEIESWEKLPRTPIRIEREGNARIVRIGHFYKDKWFAP